MKAERLFTIIGLLDEDLIEEAGKAVKRPWTQTLGTAVAACLALSLAAGPMGALLSPKGMKEEAPASSAPAAAAPAAGESAGASAEETPFLSYGGPVLALLGTEDTPLTAERTLSFNLAKPSTAQVEDLYTLSNPTDRDITFTAYYPVTGSLSQMDSILPAITVDGAAADTTLYAGRYAGRFTSAYGSSDPSGTDNLFQPNTWSFYDKRLSEGDLEDALSPAPVLEETVTVYEFSDFVTREDYDAATLAMEFTIDQEATSIMTYGINGASWDEDSGWRQYDFFVPNGMRRETRPKLLIVRGEDLADYTLQGYTDGGCETPLEGLSCSVATYKTTIGELLERLCREYLNYNASGEDVSGILKSDPENISLELFYRCASEILTEYGVLSDAPTDRYGFGRLDEVIQETLILDRIFYTAFEVTVPAGGSVTVAAKCTKVGSFDFPGTDRAGIYGYDFLTYGFLTELMISGVEITGGNVKSGMLLEPQTHYYFEIEA